MLLSEWIKHSKTHTRFTNFQYFFGFSRRIVAPISVFANFVLCSTLYFGSNLHVNRGPLDFGLIITNCILVVSSLGHKLTLAHTKVFKDFLHHLTLFNLTGLFQSMTLTCFIEDQMRYNKVSGKRQDNPSLALFLLSFLPR